MTVSPVARRYAAALFEAVHPRASTVVRNELKFLAQVLTQTPELRQFLTNPDITPATQAHFLEEKLRSLLSADTMAFLRLVVAKRRAAELAGIVAQFEELYYAATKVERVTVRSAKPLPAELRTTIQKRIASWLKEQVEMAWEVEPALLGGLQLFLGHRVVDGSVQHHLAELYTRLRTVKVH